MINPYNVAQILINLIPIHFTSLDHNNAHGARDEEVAKCLFHYIESIVRSTDYSFEIEHTIDINNNVNYEQSEEEEQEEKAFDMDDEQLDETTMEVVDDRQNNLLHKFSMEYMKKAVKFYDEKDEHGKRKHSWKSFRHRFRNVSSRKHIQRFTKYLANGGTKQQKLDEIDRYTYEKFEKARSDFLLVHDIHIKRWALQKARELGDKTFNASDHWILHFKRRHYLCSRKVIKLVTYREVINSNIIHESANSFINKIQKLLPHYKETNVLNTDQNGLEIEMVWNRTISFRGEKTTLGKVRSLYNTSYSYTVQCLLSLSGEPMGPCLLCLKEPSGRINNNIKKTISSIKCYYIM